MRAFAKEKGEGMGLAGGIIKYAINLLNGALKLAADSGTQTACKTRLKTFKDEYDEVALEMKNVYYETDSDSSAVEKVEIESKNFTLY